MPPPLRQVLLRALRLGLPLSALVLLSSVFLVSRSPDPSSTADITGMDPTEMTRTPRIATARFAGVTDDATAMTVSARSVRSDTESVGAGPLRLTFTQPKAMLVFPNASTARFDALSAVLDQSRGNMTAQGPVTLTNSDGYVLRLGELTVALDRTRLTGTGGVQGRSPAGAISADAMELTRSGGAQGGYLLAFTGNVRLLYTP